MRDTPFDYVPTVTACSTVDEWNAGNEDQGAPLASGAITIANLCQNFDVSSPLCKEAEAESPLSSVP
jgi:hypothetical protein